MERDGGQMGSRLRLAFGVAAALASAALIAACAWVNYEALTESYGSGPPYYGRTTNMDKWSNPIPTLVIIDLAVLVVALGLVAASVWLVAGRSPSSGDSGPSSPNR